ncbi:enoyl-CoA hydratase/isomerase family protein [uncultured Phenylobacterium sp.]|uniref:enoyl-CoA hydratase/isomerase family protein n=1 Tax=uncultured Phenylobacterium sp. TaxID=349273 RepID=UPI0025D659AD|nr:enoyl-CoA hydratase/isomerase family protein [uncultured Phenylobacterium sp.]
MIREGLIADLIELGGAGVSVVDAGAASTGGAGVVRVGLHRTGARPGPEDLEGFDILLSCDPAAPRPWVGVADLDAAIAHLEAEIARQPTAAAVAAQVLRGSLAVGFDQALVQESLAYSMLLASRDFRAWRAANPPRQRSDDAAPRVLIGEVDGALTITLNRPAARNAVDARMRDELCAALDFAAEHPDAPPVVLTGAGPAFSAGGDLDEFGSAAEPGQAHLIRVLRSAARGARNLGPRLTARLHGACVGAGIEVPAAAARVVAVEGAFFRLPEVSMGLIPGAGGTATIPRRIGRHRAAFMAISGAVIDLPTALAWGLVDAAV